MSAGPLATRSGITLVVALLFKMGAMCPTCGHGTRVTSKNWARCKKCDTRVRRHALPEAPDPSREFSSVPAQAAVHEPSPAAPALSVSRAHSSNGDDA